MRKKVLKVYKYLFLIGILYCLLIWFNKGFIECFYLKTTGFECPGCGTTRMFLSLFQLDFIAAFNYNPCVFVLFFAWNTVGILCLIDKFEFLRNTKIYVWGLYISIAMLTFFGLYRVFA